MIHQNILTIKDFRDFNRLNDSILIYTDSKYLIDSITKWSNSWEKNGQKFTKIFCLADKIHFLASEESSNSNSAKPDKAEIQQQEKVEKVDSDVDDIDDIPF